MLHQVCGLSSLKDRREGIMDDKMSGCPAALWIDPKNVTEVVIVQMAQELNTTNRRTVTFNDLNMKKVCTRLLYWKSSTGNKKWEKECSQALQQDFFWTTLPYVGRVEWGEQQLMQTRNKIPEYPVEQLGSPRLKKVWMPFAYMNGIIHYVFVLPKQSTKYSTFKFWNVYSNALIEEDQIF